MRADKRVRALRMQLRLFDPRDERAAHLRRLLRAARAAVRQCHS